MILSLMVSVLFPAFSSVYHRELNQLEKHVQGYQETVNRLETKLTRAKNLQQKLQQLETSPGNIFKFTDHFWGLFQKTFFYFYSHLVRKMYKIIQFMWEFTVKI